MALKRVKPFRGGNNFNWSAFKDEVEGDPSRKGFADVWGFKGDKGPGQWGWDYFHGNWGRWMRSPKKWQRNAGFNRQQDFYKAVWDLWDTDEFKHLWPGAGEEESSEVFGSQESQVGNLETSPTSFSTNKSFTVGLKTPSDMIDSEDQAHFGDAEGEGSDIPSFDLPGQQTTMPDFWR